MKKNVALKRDKRGAYSVLGKEILERLRRKWEDNIKISL